MSAAQFCQKPARSCAIVTKSKRSARLQEQQHRIQFYSMKPIKTTATQFYLHRHNLPEHAQCLLGKTDLRVSRLGFGCYRIDAASLAHAQALQHALCNGVNLIDTSTNYGDGESEQLVGQVLQELIAQKRIQRKEIVVVSKVGYVQSQNLQLAKEREHSGAPFPEMVKYMEGCWHCIHPEFLEDQLERSLARLQLSSLDALLLHNPEYFLSHAKKQHAPLQEARAEYYRRIANAFAFLERKAAEGKIAWYGISSNTFPRPSSDSEFTALEEVWNIAERLTPHHHFAVIQFPMNLFESAAVFEKNQSNGTQTLLQFAREKGLATLVNRPLNAMTGREMIRLADFETITPQHAEEIYPAQLALLAALEREFIDGIIPRFELRTRLQNLAQIFNWAEQLEGGLHLFRDWAHWDHVKQYTITPHNERALHFLRNFTRAAETWIVWEKRFRSALNTVLQTLSAVHSRSAAEKSRALHTDLNQSAPELAATPSLSQKALRVLLNTEGLDVVLLGMRRQEYVEDGLQALRAQPAQNLMAAYQTWQA